MIHLQFIQVDLELIISATAIISLAAKYPPIYQVPRKSTVPPPGRLGLSDCGVYDIIDIPAGM